MWRFAKNKFCLTWYTFDTDCTYTKDTNSQRRQRPQIVPNYLIIPTVVIYIIHITSHINETQFGANSAI